MGAESGRALDPSLTLPEFRDRLAALGLVLDTPALAAAWAGAQHLHSELARIDAYLDRADD